MYGQQPMKIHTDVTLLYNEQCNIVWSFIYIYIINEIIHEEKTKEISDMTVVVYLIQNSADLHKFLLWFTCKGKMALMFNIVDKHKHLDVGVS